MEEQHYLIRGGIQGRERLRVLARVMRPTTLPLLERAGVTAGLRCLDVGCGGGDVTFDLASLVGITGSVVGVDVDATKIELARGDAQQAEVPNVEFRVANLTDGLGEDEYDVVYARFVLTHLRRPGGRSRHDGASLAARRPPRRRGHRLRRLVQPPRVGGVAVGTTSSTRRPRCATAATPTSGGACR